MDRTDYFEEIDADDWPHALEILTKNTGSNWAFRGHANAHWPLVTSLERALDPRVGDTQQWSGLPLVGGYRPFEDPYVVEARMIESFQRRAHHYLAQSELPDEEDVLSWLALLQHYGAPMRLLDFTDSPFVATFFAFEQPTRQAAIWAVDRYALHQLAREHMHGVLAGGPEFPERWDFLEPRVYASIINACDQHQQPLVLAIEPFKLHERLVTQQGLFVVPGDIRKTFIENLAGSRSLENARRYVKKIVLPGTCGLKRSSN